MSKEIKITLKDKNTLILEEDALKGDYIDLNKIQNFDNSKVLESIENGTNELFNKMIKEKEKELEDKFLLSLDSKLKEKELNLNKHNEENISSLKEEISNLKAINESFNKEINTKVELEKSKQSNEFNIEKNNLNTKIKELEQQIETLNKTKDSEVLIKSNEIEKRLNLEISELKEVISRKESDIKLLSSEKEKEFLKEKETLNDTHKEELNKKQEEIEQVKNELEKLKLQKSFYSTKEFGEELEIWCNNEYEKYSMLFVNCEFIKDNKVIKEEGEDKGTKADFIFKIYSNSRPFIEENLLTSVCLEMKNETLSDKSTKHKNSDFYRRLDENRKKKGCEYALLVSTLEMNGSNDFLIKKVDEFENMYVIRPNYFISFLSILLTLTNKYKLILNQKKKETIELKNKTLILKEFEDLKDTYIFKPLDALIKKVEIINKEAGDISSKAENIKSIANDIINDSRNELTKKMNTYTLKMNSFVKKVEN